MSWRRQSPGLTSNRQTVSECSLVHSRNSPSPGVRSLWAVAFLLLANGLSMIFTEFDWRKYAVWTYGFVWKCCVPLNPMVLLIIIPFLNGYFIGNIPYFQTHPYSRGRSWGNWSTFWLHWSRSWSSSFKPFNLLLIGFRVYQQKRRSTKKRNDAATNSTNFFTYQGHLANFLINKRSQDEQQMNTACVFHY